MPKFKVEYIDEDGIDRDTIVEATDKHAAADQVLQECDADCIEHVKEV